jgi:hypothetical protein
MKTDIKIDLWGGIYAARRVFVAGAIYRAPTGINLTGTEIVFLSVFIS